MDYSVTTTTRNAINMCQTHSISFLISIVYIYHTISPYLSGATPITYRFFPNPPSPTVILLSAISNHPTPHFTPHFSPASSLLVSHLHTWPTEEPCFWFPRQRRSAFMISSSCHDWAVLAVLAMAVAAVAAAAAMSEAAAVTMTNDPSSLY